MYINNRQLGDPDADYMSSMRTMTALAPDLWIEPAEILTTSDSGLATCLVLRGTSTEGLSIEIPFIYLMLVNGDRVEHIETFDPTERERALARFAELTA